MDVVTSFPTYFFNNLHSINLVYAGIIALFFGVATGGAVGVFFVPAIAAIVYIAARAVIPPLLNHAAIVTPVFDKVLLEQAITLYVAFFVAILVVFAVKRSIQAVTG
jgi:hypothetical protein